MHPAERADLRDQLRVLQSGVTEIVGGSVVGMYLHGSLALGCFNPACSDVDLLIVVSQPLELDEKVALADLLLHVSAAPYGIELHVLTTDQLQRWRHPSRFELHYGESARESLAFDRVAALERMRPTDPDLAAHVKVAGTCGIALAGPPAARVFPEIPSEDYADALRRDLEWTRTPRSALYDVLSPCRVWASLETGDVHSKASGAEWALPRLPADLRRHVRRALASYRGAGEAIDLEDQERSRLQAYVEERVHSIAVS